MRKYIILFLQKLHDIVYKLFLIKVIWVQQMLRGSVG